MSFGKKQLTTNEKARLEENRLAKVVDLTEKKILRTVDPSTPLGRVHLVGDTERAMSGRFKMCPHCAQARAGDFTLERTGICSICAGLFA